MTVTYIVVIFILAPKLHKTESAQTLIKLEQKLKAYEGALEHQKEVKDEQILKEQEIELEKTFPLEDIEIDLSQLGINDKEEGLH